jgi:hypothetical protein
MTVLAVGKPFEQSKSQLLVENKLAVGRHRFSLVVVNDRGAASEPHVLVLTVRGGTGTDPRALGGETRHAGKPLSG